jgi:hypothetical protein
LAALAQPIGASRAALPATTHDVDKPTGYLPMRPALPSGYDAKTSCNARNRVVRLRIRH